jgi:tRNA(Ile2) C34 agmatinyltransferase TiaS
MSFRPGEIWRRERTVSTIFEVPCPECGRSMSASGGDWLECPTCQRTYQSRMGHLFLSGERPTSTITASATRPPVPARP